MEMIQAITDLFFCSVTSVVQSMPVLCMFLVAAFICAVVFNMIDAMLSRR